MPADDSPAVLVARFLRSNGYNETLDAYIREAGLPDDAGMVATGGFTIEKLLEEKKTFDLSVNFEKLGTEDSQSTGWTVNAPRVATKVATLPSFSNILHTSFGQFWDADRATTRVKLIATTADRRLNLVDVPSLNLQHASAAIQDSPILSCATLAPGYLLTTSMSGQLTLTNHSLDPLSSRRDHSKYAVKVAVHVSGSDSWIATAGWDAKINLYHLNLDLDSTSTPNLPAPISSISLPTNPESLLFVQHPDSTSPGPILISTRRDSSFLYHHTVGPNPVQLGRQNLAPHSNAWVAFTPSAIALCPTDPSLLAVATSTVPHMKLIIVRLLLPSLASTTGTPAPIPPPHATAAAQGRAELAVQDAEAAAISVHVSTLSPQTAYSTPALAWRPDGSGVWVNGDDGAVRGFEAATGKAMATLRSGGHEAGSKVRCLAAGMVEGEEWLVSGGFDQRLVVWRPGEEDGEGRG